MSKESVQKALAARRERQGRVERGKSHDGNPGTAPLGYNRLCSESLGTHSGRAPAARNAKETQCAP